LFHVQVFFPELLWTCGFEDASVASALRESGILDEQQADHGLVICGKEGRHGSNASETGVR